MVQKKVEDEIPLARRSSRIKRLSQKKYRLIVGSSILFGTIFTFIFNFYFLDQPNLFTGNKKLIASSDGTLLGHFPYPEAPEENLVSAYPGLKVHRDTFKALVKMRAAASAEGVNLVLLSGYRSINLQKDIFYSNKSIRNQIAAERARVSAPPGYSEHSTGYAIDLGDSTMRHTDFEVEFENTPAFKWLKKNAAKYHFILSFPRGNSQKVSYEPWHWRFEGTVDALEQFDKANQLLREELKRKN